ncbi:unnamed protein product [Phytomonas sp. EM1]|nr:unnamed protein product [Phytomonas sp. EM1]|eukprot:CCW65579.1 unnamed protein product [Phytomonas sp. isolate EM1]
MPNDAVVAHDENRGTPGTAVEVASEGSWLADLGGDTWATEGIDPQLLTAAAGVFAQCVAPKDNVNGVGVDNCSLIIVERRA